MTDQVTRREGVSIEVSELDFKIPVYKNGKSAELHAIKSVSARILPGRLTAILGPSGSGKTTFMNILSGRAGQQSIPGSVLTGTVSLNGSIVDPVVERQRFAYVLSEDAIHARVTPEESLRFALTLRQPNIPETVKQQKIDYTIEELGMENCRHIFVGNDNDIPGIRPGERKKTSVGIELINDPLVCFLDEPTTGLDSYSAYQLVSVLKNLSKEGRCVVSTIHQPASETFNMFDDAMFLGKGALLYFGPLSEIKPYFSRLGFICPDRYNVAEFVMDIIQTVSQEKLDELANAWVKYSSEKTKADIETARKNSNALSLPQIVKSPFKFELETLLRREIKLNARDRKLMAMRVMIPCFLTTLIGGVLWKQGASGATSQSHVAALTFLAINSMMSVAQPMILNFPFERPVFIREYSGGAYSVFSYFLSKLMVEVPTSLVQVLIIVTIGYFMLDLQGDYGIILSGAIINAVANAGVAMSIGAYAKNVREASEYAPLVFTPQFLFTGLFVRISTIPAVLRWIRWIVPIKYAVSIMYVGEFKDLAYGSVMMATQSIYEADLWKYYIIGISLIIALRILCLFILDRASKATVY